MVTTELDNAQILPNVYNPENFSLNVSQIAAGLVPGAYDSIALTYYTSGNGIGQIETVTYYLGGLSGTVVRTLTLSYNTSAELISVVGT